MTFKEYQELSRRTLNTALTPNEALANYGLGVAGEGGELIEMLKKHAFHGKAANLADVEGEAGDLLFYLAAVLSTFGLSLEEVAAKNVEKLKKRYPNGFEVGGGIR